MKKDISLHIILIIYFLSGFLQNTGGIRSSLYIPHIQNGCEEVTANDDLISMYENGAWTISVINNDYGLQSGIQKISIITSPKNGTAEVLSDYNIRYTPNERFVGTDHFEYRICNNDGNCDEASVSVIVEDYDYIPKPLNDTIIYYSDSSSVFNVLVNDENLYDLPLELSIIKDLNNGYSEITDDLKIKLNFTSYFIDTDSLIYQICDKEGDCGQATLFVSPYRDSSTPLLIPEAFSPNGDGYNDTFSVPEFNYYQQLFLLVFNQNGIKVFESYAFNNKWDGVANTGPLKGRLVPKGVYYYVIKIGGSSEEFKGYLYISH